MAVEGGSETHLLVKFRNNRQPERLFLDESLQKTLLSDITSCMKIDLIKSTQKSPEKRSKQTDFSWGKSLDYLPIFTRREIENHVKKCGKSKGKSIIKTSVRGLKFQSERYLSADSLFTSWTETKFIIKCQCKASMKRVMRTVFIHISRSTSEVNKASCSCPAGKSGYCNHVMALLFEVAGYSLQSLTTVPAEIACTSKLRAWGVPGQKEIVKQPVMKTTLIADVNKKGVHPTLYDPRLNFNLLACKTEILTMQNELSTINKHIGYAHVIPNEFKIDTEYTEYGAQYIGSPLSYQLLPVERSFKILTNIPQIVSTSLESYSDISLCKLPFNSIPWVSKWTLDQNEIDFLSKLEISYNEATNIESKTISQRENKLWKDARKFRITSSMCHKIFIRQRNFETLVKQFLEKRDLSKVDSIKHGIINEDIAYEKYIHIMNFKLFQNICIRKTGIVIQPNLHWLGASPDGLVLIPSEKSFGLIEIKCPYSKRNVNVENIISDPDFYIGVTNGEYYLKKTHSSGYYSQVQMAMGISALKWCHFIVYVYSGMIIVKVAFDKTHFESVIEKLNIFYKNFFMKHFLNN